jgi:predicted ABC-type ATPase
VKERVSMRGHDVPAQTILRRFNRGLYNLFHLYQSLLDSWMLFDNSGDLPRVIAKAIDGVTTVFDKTLFAESGKESVNLFRKTQKQAVSYEREKGDCYERFKLPGHC